MSDERAAAGQEFSAHMANWGEEASLPDFLAGWDVGRASRDAEVAAAELQADQMRWARDEWARSYEAMQARAEAAEAVIVAAARILPSNVADAYDILSVAPLTVLAERDRKNREEAWDEGAMYIEESIRDGNGEEDAVNPYAEKEQGNGK